MAKKVVSVALHKKKRPIKHISKRKKLKTALKKIFSYMKSDTYMFAPLLCPQSHPSSSPVSFGSCEPVEKKETNKLLEDVGDYLKCDCYMYAPLVTDSVSDSAKIPRIGDLGRGKGDTVSISDQIEETTRQDGNSLMSGFREIERGDIDISPTSTIVVRHKLMQKETVKHVVHQNCGSSSVPGKVSSHKKPRKIVVE